MRRHAWQSKTRTRRRPHGRDQRKQHARAHPPTASSSRWQRRLSLLQLGRWTKVVGELRGAGVVPAGEESTKRAREVNTRGLSLRAALTELGAWRAQRLFPPPLRSRTLEVATTALPVIAPVLGAYRPFFIPPPALSFCRRRCHCVAGGCPLSASPSRSIPRRPDIGRPLARCRRQSNPIPCSPRRKMPRAPRRRIRTRRRRRRATASPAQLRTRAPAQKPMGHRRWAAYRPLTRRPRLQRSIRPARRTVR